MTIEEFVSCLEKENISISSRQLEQFLQYYTLLIDWNQRMNLTAITKQEEVYEKHFMDCIYALPSSLGHTVCDVGTGAGFPGIVWKIMRPEISITLLEPTNKRVLFLNEVIRQLNLKDAMTVNQRAEDYIKEKREYYDTVVARAVANLPVLSELCLPFVKVGGHFIAMKGSKAMEEYESAKKAIHILGGKLTDSQKRELSDNNVGYNLDIVKIQSTPDRYPRRYDQIKKRPL